MRRRPEQAGIEPHGLSLTDSEQPWLSYAAWPIPMPRREAQARR